MEFLKGSSPSELKRGSDSLLDGLKFRCLYAVKGLTAAPGIREEPSAKVALF